MVCVTCLDYRKGDDQCFEFDNWPLWRGGDAFLLTISPRVLLSPTKAFPVNNDFLNSLFVDCVLCTFLGLSKIG